MKSRKPTNILLTIRQGKIGGGESHVLDLIKTMDRSKFTPIVLSFTAGPMVSELQDAGIRTEVIYTEKPFDFRVWRKVKDLLIKEQIKLVHAHGTRANSNIFWAAKKLNIPIIYTVHGWSFHQDQSYPLRRLRELGEKFLNRNSDLTILVSESNYRDGKEKFNLQRGKIINYGIDLDKFNPNNEFSNLREELNINSDETLVGYIVRITIQKDPYTMIKAIAKVLNETKKVKFLIVGDGDLKNSMIALATTLGITDNVIFQNFSKDIPNILSNIDIYCLPSLWEGLPIGLLEAMAMKKAIIATPVDGTKEAIINKESGLLISQQSPDELSQAIIMLHNNRDLIDKYGVKARETIKNKFNLVRMTREIEHAYDEILHSN